MLRNAEDDRAILNAAITHATTVRASILHEIGARSFATYSRCVLTSVSTSPHLLSRLFVHSSLLSDLIRASKSARFASTDPLVLRARSIVTFSLSLSLSRHARYVPSTTSSPPLSLSTSFSLFFSEFPSPRSLEALDSSRSRTTPPGLRETAVSRSMTILRYTRS